MNVIAVIILVVLTVVVWNSLATRNKGEESVDYYNGNGGVGPTAFSANM